MMDMNGHDLYQYRAIFIGLDSENVVNKIVIYIKSVRTLISKII